MRITHTWQRYVVKDRSVGEPKEWVPLASPAHANVLHAAAHL